MRDNLSYCNSTIGFEKVNDKGGPIPNIFSKFVGCGSGKKV